MGSLNILGPGSLAGLVNLEYNITMVNHLKFLDFPLVLLMLIMKRYFILFLQAYSYISVSIFRVGVRYSIDKHMPDSHWPYR